jgi:hypothetical protein
VFTNSTFLLFLRLPDGRAGTLTYLKKLRSFDGPLMVKAKDNGTEYVPNPKLPQFPVGTEVALVRRAMLVDSTHMPVATALTESVQFRAYRKVPQLPATAFDLDVGGGRVKQRGANFWQSFHEFRLSRALLFAGQTGGLRAVGSDELDFETGFASHPYDEFEWDGYRPPAKSFAESRQYPIKSSCISCHALPGIASFNSFFDYRHNLHGEALRPYTLLEMPVAEVAGAAVKWKEGRPSWAALRKLLEE